MALPIYIEIEGEKQGKFTGGCTRKSREGMIEAFEADHQVEIPTDRLTGKATGNRVHGPFVFYKEIDKSSPLIQMALVTGENIKTMKVHFWQITPAGQEREFYTITLSDAQIVTVRSFLPNVHSQGQLKPSEEVALRYSKIEWLITDGNITAMDSWFEPVAVG